MGLGSTGNTATVEQRGRLGDPSVRSKEFCDTLYLPQHGIISPKLQLLSGHTAEQSLAMYRELTLGDVVDEYEAAMRTFPVR